MSAVVRLLLGTGLAAGIAFGAVAQSATGDTVARTELRVCADPNNLPFSNEKSEGFENKIAEVIGRDLALPVSYFWFPQIIGFVRNGLEAGRCDLVIGTVAGDELMQTTTPYYHTSYVLVVRDDSKITTSDLDDPAFKSLHIGVISGTPPSDLLVHHALMGNARPYALTVDTRFESPPHQMLKDIADGSIDAGMIWGPFAGYYITHDKLPLRMIGLRSEPGMPRLDYHIAMGVRYNEPDWRRRINEAIHKHQSEIDAILRDYGVPLLDEQGALMKP
ncbi:MAG TPA: substrate-binding domain-containing protein [Stellaceae bacterium]|nr:substrate-binding domain-containing protein [Stellaceae bacterium]